LVRAPVEALRKEFLRLDDGRVLDVPGVRDLVDAAFARHVPALDPIGDVERAVGTEVAVGCQDRPDERVNVGYLERGSFRLDGERPDAAVARVAAKIAQKEMAGVARI